MKLHWGPVSPFVRKVLICAYEIALETRIARVQSFVAMNAANDNVMRDNPLSKIPTLIRADGTALFDSDVICEYLDSLHDGKRLIPETGEPRWQALRWNALGSGMLDALVLWRNERMRPVDHQSVPTLETYAKKIAAALDMVECEVPALNQADFGLGHIAIGCMFGYFDFRFSDIDWRAKHPASAQWFSEFSSRPSAQLTHPALSEKPSEITEITKK